MGFSISDITGAIGDVAGWFDDGYKRDTWSAYNSVQARVQDAKKAGVHPLFALGASPAQANIISDTRSLDGITGAFRDREARLRGREADRRESRIAQSVIAKNESEARLNDAERVAVNSRVARDMQNAMTRQDQGIEYGMNPDLLITPGSGKWQTGQSSEQQAWEDNYGGIVGEVAGLIRFATDAINIAGETLRKNQLLDRPQSKGWGKNRRQARHGGK